MAPPTELPYANLIVLPTSQTHVQPDITKQEYVHGIGLVNIRFAPRSNGSGATFFIEFPSVRSILHMARKQQDVPGIALVKIGFSPNCAVTGTGAGAPVDPVENGADG